jgi:hypothetical protein
MIKMEAIQTVLTKVSIGNQYVADPLIAEAHLSDLILFLNLSELLKFSR